MNYVNKIRSERKLASDAVPETKRAIVALLNDLERSLRAASAPSATETMSITLAGVAASRAAIEFEVGNLFSKIHACYERVADAVVARDKAARIGLAEQARRYGID